MAKYSEDSKLKEILQDPRVIELIKQNFGEALLKHPLMPMAKMFTVKKALAYKSKLPISEEKLMVFIAQVMELE